MLKSLVIVVIGIIPALVSFLMMRKAEARARHQLRTAMDAATRRGLQQFHDALSSDHQYGEGIGYLLGDLTCRFNARSAYLRCAVNPSGPCTECPYYESIACKD